MPYIGKSPTGSGVRTRYYFTATGGETSLSGADDGGKTLTFSDGEYVDVYLNGIALVAGTDYGTATANTISGLAALSTDDIVEVVVYDIYNVAKINSEAVRTRHYYTATGGETSIGTAQIPGLSFPGGTEIEVSLNGISLVAGTDYNTTAANTVGGLSALSAGNVIEIIIYDKFQLADTVSKAQGGAFSGPVTASGGLNVGTIKEATGTTTAMTIDSDGRVNLGVPVHGHFYQNAAAASLGAVATLVKLTLDSTYEQSGGFSLASNEVTVPLTGRYRWSVAIALDVSAARRAVSFVLYKNGSIDSQNQFTHFAFPYVSGTTHNMLTASNTINCTAGDDVSLYLREYDNNNMTVRVYHFAMDFIG